MMTGFYLMSQFSCKSRLNQFDIYRKENNINTYTIYIESCNRYPLTRAGGTLDGKIGKWNHSTN